MSNKDFEKLVSKLATALSYRISCELISSSPQNKHLRHHFFFLIRQSLTQSFIIEVAKVFDSSKTQPNLTVFQFLGNSYPWSPKSKKTMQALKNFRDKFLMHNDLVASRDITEFLKNIGLTPDSVMSLSEEAFTQLGKLAETDRSLKFGINSMASIKLRTEKSFKDFLQTKDGRA